VNGPATADQTRRDRRRPRQQCEGACSRSPPAAPTASTCSCRTATAGSRWPRRGDSYYEFTSPARRASRRHQPGARKLDNGTEPARPSLGGLVPGREARAPAGHRPVTARRHALVSVPVVAPMPQPVTESATRRPPIFLVLTVNSGDESRDAVRRRAGELPGLVRAVGQRDLHGQLSCVAAFRSDAGTGCSACPARRAAPLAEAAPLPGLAVSTAGDILLHIRAKRMDLCFELALQSRSRLGGGVNRGGGGARVPVLRRPRPHRLSSTAPRTPRRRTRSLRRSSATRTRRSPGGGYVLVQRYAHDLAQWMR